MRLWKIIAACAMLATSAHAQMPTGTPITIPALAAQVATHFAPSASVDTTNAANITSGTLPANRLPFPGVSALGGVQASTGASHQWVSGIGTNGVPTLSQPTLSDINGAGSMAGQSAASVAVTGGAIRGLSALGSNGPFSLTGTGGSGQYDAQVAVSGGGANAGQGTLQLGSALSLFLGSDASPQAAVQSNPGASEYWQFAGNPATAGAILLATNGTATGNVNGYFAAQHQGTTTFGNGSGIALQILDPGGPAGAYLQILPANHAASGPSGAAITAGLLSTGDIAIIPAVANSRFGVAIPDGTAVGGNTRGQFSVDLQMQNSRGIASAIAGGQASCLVAGTANWALGTSSCVVGGFANVMTGAYSFAGAGQNGSDDGRLAAQIYSGSFFAQSGDNERVQSVFGNSSTGSAASRLTVNHLTAASTNCMNLVNGKVAAFDVIIAGNDITTAAHHVGWYNHALLYHEATGVTMGIALGTAVTLGTDTVTVSMTVDQTNGCLNATVTAANSDTWHWEMTTTAAEVK